MFKVIVKFMKYVLVLLSAVAVATGINEIGWGFDTAVRYKSKFKKYLVRTILWIVMACTQFYATYKIMTNKK